MVGRAGAEARLGFKAHPHMLRHACGYALANKGHDTRALQAYLGHRNIQHTVRYTELRRFSLCCGGHENNEETQDGPRSKRTDLHDYKGD
jgi:site-specific recombinase XerD